MKRIISSIFIAAIATFANTSALADPITHSVDYVCPSASSLANFGSHIGGFGSEILSSSTTSTIFFQSRKPLNNVPSSLANYSNAGTNYDGPSGFVTCSFSSSNLSEGDFDISYNIANGKGGRITLRTNNTIRILFFVGFRK